MVTGHYQKEDWVTYNIICFTTHVQSSPLRINANWGEASICSVYTVHSSLDVGISFKPEKCPYS